MTTHCPPIINQLIKSNESYLELGINDGGNFNSINAGKKYSVDFNGATNPNFAGTTDAYFASNPARFDFIFIDANHDYDYVLRDLCNSSKFADKMIILHDMNPPTKFHCHSGQCSDSYKLLTLLKKETEIDIFTLNDDFGLSFVPITEKSRNIIIPEELVEQYRSLSYEDFVAYRDQSIKLYETDLMVHTLKEYV